MNLVTPILLIIIHQHFLTTMSSPVKLDSTSVPHIIDTIISHASADVVLAICSTSKHYRKRLATFLQHASIRRTKEDWGTQYLTSLSPHPLTPVCVPFVPALVEVLDQPECLCDECPVFCAAGDDLGAWSSLRVLRRMALAPCIANGLDTDDRSDAALLPVHTVVDFIDLNKQSDALSQPWADVHHHTKRYIAHLRWHEIADDEEETNRNMSALKLHRHGHIGRHEPLEIVIVLRSHTSDGHIPSPRNAAALVGRVLAPISWEWPDAPYALAAFTIVGAETFHYSLSGMIPASDGRAATSRAFVTFVMGYLARREHDPDAATEILANHTTFLDLDGWMSSLGEEKALLGEWVE